MHLPIRQLDGFLVVWAMALRMTRRSRSM